MRKGEGWIGGGVVCGVGREDLVDGEWEIVEEKRERILIEREGIQETGGGRSMGNGAEGVQLPCRGLFPFSPLNQNPWVGMGRELVSKFEEIVEADL